MNLLCRIGLHHATWVPHFRESRDLELKVPTCKRCGKPLPRPHR